MVGRRPRYRVLPRAWQDWEKHDTGPWTLTEVVDAMEGLPEEVLEVGRELRPPAVLQIVRGTVFGSRFAIHGVRGPDGLWIEVWRVRPLKGGVS